MATLKGGKVVTNKIPDKKPVPSPRGDGAHNPQASPRPEGRTPYQSINPSPSNYAAREAELKADRKTLDAPRPNDADRNPPSRLAVDHEPVRTKLPGR
jgi:hypothetical protein